MPPEPDRASSGFGLRAPGSGSVKIRPARFGLKKIGPGRVARMPTPGSNLVNLYLKEYLTVSGSNYGNYKIDRFQNLPIFKYQNCFKFFLAQETCTGGLFCNFGNRTPRNIRNKTVHFRKPTILQRESDILGNLPLM